MRQVLLVLVLPAFAIPALASDGVLEINQTCAVETGCFPGDASGFPVTISQPGSYVVTSNLAPASGQPSSLVEVLSGASATIDLNGFTLAGPPGQFSPTRGVTAASPVTVRNGTFESVRSGVESTMAGSLVEGIRFINALTGVEIVSGTIRDVSYSKEAPPGRVIVCVGKCVVESVSGRVDDFSAVSIGSGTISDSFFETDGAPNLLLPTLASSGRVVILRSSIVGRIDIGTGVIDRSTISCWGSGQDIAVTGGVGVSILDSTINCNIFQVDAVSIGAQAIVKNSKILGDMTVGPNSVVEGNSVVRTQDSERAGIFAGAGSRVHGNSVATNSTAGIECATGCVVSDNTVDRCGTYGLLLGASSSYRANNVDCGAMAAVNGGVNAGDNVCNGSLTCP